MKLRDSQLQVLWISRIDYSKNSGVKKHDHNFYQLLFVIDGEGDIVVGNKSYPVQSNFCYLFKENVSHEFYFTKKSATIDIKFTINDDILQCIEQSEFPDSYQVKNMVQLEELFQLSTEMQKKNNFLFSIQIDIGFKYVLLGILQEHLSNHVSSLTTTSISEANECYSMVQFLKQHFNEEINLSDIANHFGFHPHYFIELFKKNVGMTPMHYLQFLRLDKAKRYLEVTSYSIEEIAYLVGFTPAYFTRLCCKRLGMPPSKLREQMRTVIGRNIILEEDFIIDTQPSILSDLIIN